MHSPNLLKTRTAIQENNTITAQAIQAFLERNFRIFFVCNYSGPRAACGAAAHPGFGADESQNKYYKKNPIV
jgi:hypothetical protein